MASSVEPQQRRWVFTVWPAHILGGMDLDEWWAWFKNQPHTGVRYIVAQMERATTTQAVHVQGYIHYSKVKRPSTIGRVYGLKPESFQRGSEHATPADNRGYCTEIDKRVPGTEPWEFGECPGKQGSRLTEVARSIKARGLKRTVQDFPATYISCGHGMRDLSLFYLREEWAGKIRDVQVNVIWGAPGSGKSYWAETMYDPGNSWALPDEQGTTWIDGYDGQRTLVIEDFKGKIPFRTLLRMLDNYPLEMQTKGGFMPARWSEIVVTSNFHPNSWYGDDVDPWGFEISPLQRRINRIVQTRGQHPNSEYIIMGQMTDWVPMDRLPVLADIVEATEPETADAQSSTSGNASPTVEPDLEDEIIEELLGDDLDFLRGIELGVGADPDNILLGTDGDVEPQFFTDLYDVV